MRVSLLAALLVLAGTAHADPPRRQKGVEETGKKRTIQIQAPRVDIAAPRATGDAPDVERGPFGEAPPPRTDAPPLSGALLDLVERQMRRNQPSIDTCVLEETLRTPTARGDLKLTVEVVERKVQRAVVTGDGLGSAALNECLVKAAAGWTFNLKAARFDWPVTVRPAQARR